MANTKKTVELFYDVISAYSWFAFEVLCRYQHRWNINLKLRPFFLGGIVKESGNKAPAVVPNKLIYMKKDLTSLADYFDVPINLPENLKEVLIDKGTLSTQRFLTAVDMKCSDMLENVSREFWMRNWSRDEDITLAESFAEAGKKAGLSRENLAVIIPLVKTEAVKQKLKATTQEALDLGAFGSPMIVTDVNGKKEWVFGSDRFHILAKILGEKWEGPLPGS
ncbi:Glutathione S-transferase kappa 1 [Bulinus truncatus]|nr:Glutathione S-transferase kappa 1 [Bulinus truncatus]